MNEEDLKTRFDALRSEDARVARRFEAVVARARRSRSFNWTVVPALVLVSAIGALLIFWPGGSAPRERAMIQVGLREPEPLAFLLAPVSVSEESP